MAIVENDLGVAGSHIICEVLPVIFNR